MKRLIVWGLIFLFGAGLTTLALLNIGEVSIRWDVWQIDTSLSFVLALVLVFAGLLWLLLRSWLWLVSLPEKWAKRREIKRYQKAEQSLSLGLIAQEQADWAQAEKQLIRTAKLAQNGVMHYLTAARMAHMQQASARRDQYLQQAREHYPDQNLMIGLVEAKLLEEQDLHSSRIILQELYRLHPKHKALLSEYVKVLRLQKDSATLETLRADIKKYAGLSSQQWQTLDNEIHALRLAQMPDYQQLAQYWQGLSHKQKLQPLVMSEYVKASIGFREMSGLAEWLEKSVKAQWDEGLVYLYGKLEFGPAYDRLKRAQAWSEHHPKNPVLLLTLGRLACQSQLWGQAHAYLRESLQLQPELETFHALALCYEAEGQDSQAAIVYKQAIAQLEDAKLNQ